MGFENKVVIVTGAGSGIGRATAIAFAREGARVGLCDVDAAACAQTAEIIGQSGTGAVWRAADVAKRAEVRAFVDTVVDELGTLDVLVNNAGISSDGSAFADTSEAAWRRVFDVNLHGHFFCAQSAAAHMRVSGGGVIINTASVLALATLPTGVAYITSKAAILGLTKALANELGPLNIRVNCLAPGSTDTAMMWEGLTPEEKPAVEAEVAKAQPLGRVGKPAEIAGATLFLASEQASFITGVCLVVDGGLLTRIATTR